MPFFHFQEAVGADPSLYFFDNPTPSVIPGTRFPSHLHRFWGRAHCSMDSQTLSFDYWGLLPTRAHIGDIATRPSEIAQLKYHSESVFRFLYGAILLLNQALFQQASPLALQLVS